MPARKTTITIETIPDAPEAAPRPAETQVEPTVHDLFETLVEAAGELRRAQDTESALNESLDDAMEARRTAQNAYNNALWKLRNKIEL
jgi:hypothetical protein